MARIMKVRTIPRGYVGMSELKGFVHEHNGKRPAEWFMALYGKFGNPQDGGLWSYLLRHNNILLKVTAKDAETMDYDVWVSPGFVLEARRKRVKAINVIARRLNEKNIIFQTENDNNSLYYVIKQKNSELLAKKNMSASDISSAMDSAMTEEEKYALRGPISQYMDDAKKEIVGTIKEIFDEQDILQG